MRLSKWLLSAACALGLLLAVTISFTIGWRPFFGPKARPLTARTFEPTAQRLDRGRYIATALSGCIYCHSPHDWNAPGTPLLPGKEGSGEILPYADLPGRVVAPNLTPDLQTGAGGWSDDQLARAIREGVGHDGHALFPMMPYTHYRQMSDEDLASVIVYLRSIVPVHNELPKTEITFPVKYLIRTAPEPVTSSISDLPATSPAVVRGAYLVSMAGCSDCHTPQKNGRDLPGMVFAGGFPLSGPWGNVVSANITPDASGISYYDEALFLEVFHSGSVKARPLSPAMPIQVYKNLRDDDLRLMFAYLSTIKPVQHRVDNTEQPTLCKICGQKHGDGDRN
jgi:mono/diheme cytochrome c family protein